MDFVLSRTYHIKMDEEDDAVEQYLQNHPTASKANDPNYPSNSTKQLSDLVFSGKDLLKAIITMGMLRGESFKKCRKAEIEFKLAMVKAALKEKYVKEKTSGQSYYCLHIDSTFINNLDSTEKGSISYWLGMFFATLLAQNKYGYEHVTHYSLFEKTYKTQYSFNKIGYISKKNKKVTKSTPDLIATDRGLTKFGVFEAKGMENIRSDTMIHAYNQVKQVKGIVRKVDNTLIVPSENIVSYTRLSIADLFMRIKDPTGGDDTIEMDWDALIWQYEPLYELNEEIKHSRYDENSFPLLYSIAPNGLNLNNRFCSFYEGYIESGRNENYYRKYIKENDNVFPYIGEII